MTQYARPDSDVSDGRWVNSAGNNTNLYSYIDESTVSDSDYIQVTDEWGSTDTCIFGLGDVTDPSSASDHKFTVRYSDSSYSGSTGLTATLLQGASTTIRAFSVYLDPDGSFAETTITLTESEANNISDYSDLRLKIQITDDMGMGAVSKVSWAYFECPDASVAAVSNPAFLLFVD